MLISYNGLRVSAISTCPRFPQACAELHALPRLGGIFHLAGVLDDGLIHNMTHERVRRVVAPKAGLLPLLELCDTHGLTPPWVVLASSTSSLLGYAGQANYCAANGLFDHAAAFGLPQPHPSRQGQSAPPRPPAPAVLTLNFGPWGEVGMAREGTKAHSLSLASGETPMASSDAIGCIATALRTLIAARSVAPANTPLPCLQYAIADMQWWKTPWPEHSLLQRVMRRLPRATTPAPQTESQKRSTGKNSPEGPALGMGGRGDLHVALHPSTDIERRAVVEEWLRERLNVWEPDSPLAQSGLDSLDLVQLRNAFNKRFRREGCHQDDVPLSVFSNANQTMSGLVDTVCASLHDIHEASLA